MDSSGSASDDDFSFALRLHSELNGPKTQEQYDMELVNKKLVLKVSNFI